MKSTAYHSPSSLHHKAQERAESIYNSRGHNQQTQNYAPYYAVDPNFGITPEIQSAQNRANGLYFENSVAAGIVNAMVDGAIGIGLAPQSYAHSALISVSKEEIAKTQKMIEALWDVWSNSPEMCDHYHKQTFGSLQREAYVNALTGGDVLQHIKIVRFGNVYLPQIQNISGKNVKSELMNDSKKMAGGVEVDEQGREVAFHIAVSGNDLATEIMTKVFKYGARTNRLMYNLVLLGQVVPGQRRGRSILTRVAEPVIQIQRYSEAELVKAILQSYITLFIEGEKDAEEDPADDPIENLKATSVAWQVNSEGETIATAVEEQEQQLTLGPGLIYNLPPGKKITLPESKAPVAEFWKFMEAQLKMVGMAVGIPYEVLIKSFNASYSASQASIQDAARGWKIAATEWAYKYCQPVYDQFVEMLVRQNLISCQNFLDNPITRKAWCAAEWHGPAVLHVDPRKSVESSVTAIKNNLSTHEIEARKLFGLKWEAVIDRLKEERVIIGEQEGQLITREDTSDSEENPDGEEDEE